MKLPLDVSALTVDTFEITIQDDGSPYTAFCDQLESLRHPNCVLNERTEVCITPRCIVETE